MMYAGGGMVHAANSNGDLCLLDVASSLAARQIGQTTEHDRDDEQFAFWTFASNANTVQPSRSDAHGADR